MTGAGDVCSGHFLCCLSAYIQRKNKCAPDALNFVVFLHVFLEHINLYISQYGTLNFFAFIQHKRKQIFLGIVSKINTSCVQ